MTRGTDRERQRDRERRERTSKEGDEEEPCSFSAVAVTHLTCGVNKKPEKLEPSTK